MTENIEKESMGPGMRMKEQTSDPQAFGEVYDEFAAHLYRYISFRVSQPQDVEDILSKVFLGSFEALSGGKKVAHMRAFLYQAARNAIVDYFRQRMRVQEQEEIEEVENRNIAHAHDGGIESSVDMSFDLMRVRQGMNSLKQEYQEAIQLRYIEELNISEIAHTLDKSQVAVRVLLFRALKALKKKLGVTP